MTTHETTPAAHPPTPPAEPRRTFVARLLAWSGWSAVDNIMAALPLMIGVVSAIIGQFYFSFKRDDFNQAVAYYAVACVAFLIALHPRLRVATAPRARRAVDVDAFIAWARQHALRIAAVVIAVIMVFIVGWRANDMPPGQSVVPLFYAWAVALVGAVAAFVPAEWLALGDVWARLRARAQRARVTLGLLAVIMLIAGASRLIALDSIPGNLAGDEASQGMEARAFMYTVDNSPGPSALAPRSNPFETGWYFVPTMSFFYNSWGLRVFGWASILALRLPWALLGILSVLGTFLFVREGWRSVPLALLAAFLLTVNHFHLHFSRLGSVQIADAFFITFSFWLYLRAERTKRMHDFVFAGLFIGLSLYFYYGARVIGVILAGYVLYRMVSTRGYWSTYRNGLLAAGLLVALTTFPLLRNFMAHPEAISARFNQVGIVPSGWLEREVQITGKSEGQLWFEQFKKSISAFNYTYDPTFWYGPEAPLLDNLTGMAFVLGLAVMLWRWRKPEYLLLALWFWFSLGIGWVLTENPPSSMRMVIITPAVATIAALALWELARAAQRLWPRSLNYAAPVLLLAIMFLNFNFYFYEYTPRNRYGNADAETMTQMGLMLEKQPDANFHVYLFSQHLDLGFSTLPYLVPTLNATQYRQPLNGAVPPLVDPQKRSVFIFTEDNPADLRLMSQAYPVDPRCLFEGKRHDDTRAFTAYQYPCPP